MEGKNLGRIAILLLALLVFMSTAFTIQEGQRGLVLRLGKIQRDAAGQPLVKKPGLHFKAPFTDRALFFNVKLRTLEPPPSSIVTAKQKDVIVDYFVKWQIINPALFFTRTGGHDAQASLLLTQQVNDKLRAEFGKRTIGEVVSDDRLQIMSALRDQVNASAEHLGLRVLDVRIKRIDLPSAVSNSVFARMRTERKRVATEHRATGEAQAEAIRTSAQGKATVVVARTRRQAAQLRAQGDALAAQRYAKAYSADPEFYAFYRSVNAYRETFAHKNDVLVLKPDGQFFKYFSDARDRHHG